MYVNVIKKYVEAIIKCRYRLTYNVHVDFIIDKFSCIFEMGSCEL